MELFIYRTIIGSRVKSRRLEISHNINESILSSTFINDVENDIINNAPIIIIKTLAEELQCDKEYLTGEIDTIRYFPKTGEIINTKFKTLGITKINFAKLVGISTTTLNDTINGKYIPRTKVIYDMSKIFNCSIEELIGSDIKD